LKEKSATPRTTSFKAIAPRLKKGWGEPRASGKKPTLSRKARQGWGNRHFPSVSSVVRVLPKAYNHDSMPISPARTAAFDILLRVERDAAYASELLHAATYNPLSKQDHGLATELVMGVLRWRSRLDAEISKSSSQPLAKLDLEILIALRLALYQFRWLDRIPPRAALHESVELVKRARKRSAAPFVNAVLRNLSATSAARTTEGESPDSLASEFAHPPWLVERWANAYGLDVARRICSYDQSVPVTSVRLRTSAAESTLEEQGIALSAGRLLSSACIVDAGDITNTRAFRTGEIVIQDEASQLVAALLTPTLLASNTRILDCCAAPGGKTLAVSDRNPEARVTAVERHPHRARLLQKLLRAAQASSRIRVMSADATDLPISASFDCILADVPCSGTGTLARNPEIKWRISPSDLVELQVRQTKILRSAMQHLAPGGRLLYSTCSLEKEENEDVVERALAQNCSVRLLDCRPELDRLRVANELVSRNNASLTRGLFLRTIPGVHPCDGFFAAILEGA
jgi:16S rRNA (cytosine967-C5)-methyltransferase